MLENTSEAAMVLLDDNKTIYFNARHTSVENAPPPYGRVTGYSVDGGDSWDLEYNSSHSPPDTRAPSPTSLVLLPEGTVLMALPTKGYHEGLTVFASSDGGHSWPW